MTLHRRQIIRNRSLHCERLESRHLLHAGVFAELDMSHAMDGGSVDISPKLAGEGVAPLADDLALWLDADQGITIGGSGVILWEDQSGNGNDVEVVDDGPELVADFLNGQAVVRFDGIDDGLGRTGIVGLPVGNADRTVFMVANYLGGDGWGGIAYGEAMDNRAFGLVSSSGNPGRLTVQGWGVGNDFRSMTTGIGGGWLSQSVVLTGDTTFHYKDGEQIDSDSHIFDTATTQIRVGVELNDNRHMEMEIAEILVYNRALTESERMLVEAYLQSAYFTTENTPPVAVDDRYQVPRGEILDTELAGLPSVLDNDFDIDMDTLVAVLVDGPLHGSLILDVDGSFIYTPDSGSSLSDSFTYRADDGQGQSLLAATVTIDILQGPPVMDGLVMRLDADQGLVTTGADVTAWNDLTGNGNDLSVIGASPMLVSSALNGQDIVRFDGVDDGLGRADFLGLPLNNADRTVFMVANYVAGEWSGFSYGAASPNRAFGLISSGIPDGTLTLQGWGPANDAISGTPGVGAGWLSQSVVVDADSFTHFKDGAVIDLGTRVYNTGSQRVRLGVELNDARRMQMDVAEILVYDRALTASERIAVESYLQLEYGLSTSQPGDFDNDGELGCNDLDLLGAEVASGGSNLLFDVNGDTIVDAGDVESWVTELFGTGLGDANLDGSVNVGDFDIWNANRFTTGKFWCSGDFNTDSVVDVSDFNIWNANKLLGESLTNDIPARELAPSSLSVNRLATPTKIQLQIVTPHKAEANLDENMLQSSDQTAANQTLVDIARPAGRLSEIGGEGDSMRRDRLRMSLGLWGMSDSTVKWDDGSPSLPSLVVD